MIHPLAQRKPDTTHRIASVRPLTPADLEFLRQKSFRPRLLHIKEAHHNVARLVAAGLSRQAVAARLGYTEARITMLTQDPSIRELIESYRAEVTQSWRESLDSLHEDAVRAMKTGVRNIAERFDSLDEDAEAIPLKDVANITSSLMDRFGPAKRSANLNINVDFARKLEEAIARSRKA